MRLRINNERKFTFSGIVWQGLNSRLLTHSLNKVTIAGVERHLQGFAMLHDHRVSVDSPSEMPLMAAQSQTPCERAVVRSEDLLQGRVEVLIEHGAETYRLRLTRSGKLILQK